MSRFLLVYRGGPGMAETEEERAASTAEWTGWFGTLGEGLVDAGNPVGEKRVAGANGSGHDEDGEDGEPVSGYSIVAADDIDAAQAIATASPVVTGGGIVDVYEIIPAM